MNETTLCQHLHCKNLRCKTLMRLPLDKLSQLTIDPADPTTHASAIALICPHCTQIYTYSLQSDSTDRACEDLLVSRERAEGMNLLKLLECEEGTCQTCLPLIDVWSPTATIEQREVNSKRVNWNELQSLTCPNGHPIPYPQ